MSQRRERDKHYGRLDQRVYAFYLGWYKRHQHKVYFRAGELASHFRLVDKRPASEWEIQHSILRLLKAGLLIEYNPDYVPTKSHGYQLAEPLDILARIKA
jgi:hypothetical protein